MHMTIKLSTAFFLLLSLISPLYGEDCCGADHNKGVANTLDAKGAVTISTKKATSNPADSKKAKPLRALLISGGCCHDYQSQNVILSDGISARANIHIDVVWTRDPGHDPKLPLFKDPNWAEGYDFIIHNHCAALSKDDQAIENIVKAHQSVPAVHIHCAVHSFRATDNQWHEHIGISSDRHGPHVPVAVDILEPKHPIVANLDDWVTEKEELYNNKEVYGATPLAVGTQSYQQGGQEVTEKAIVAWINTKYGAPSFTTTLGNYGHNMEDPRFLEMVTRGALWVCGKLDDEAYVTPYKGENTLTEIPYDTNIRVSAASSQAGNPVQNAFDGDSTTRWCASSAATPSWCQIEFLNMTMLGFVEIDWEIADQWVQYQIETSRDGKTWKVVYDGSSNTLSGPRRDGAVGRYDRFVRVNVLKQQNGMWPSIREVRLFDNNGVILNTVVK